MWMRFEDDAVGVRIGSESAMPAASELAFLPSHTLSPPLLLSFPPPLPLAFVLPPANTQKLFPACNRKRCICCVLIQSVDSPLKHREIWKISLSPPPMLALSQALSLSCSFVAVGYRCTWRLACMWVLFFLFTYGGCALVLEIDNYNYTATGARVILWQSGAW